MSNGIRCMWMRGGTSKGAYFLADDLPSDAEQRDELLLRLMGSPDPRQIDGIGGGDPLSSKVAVVKKSSLQGADIDYLFLQVFVDQALVSSAQNCGNLLAGVGPFAIERGLLSAEDGETSLRVFMQNTGKISSQIVVTPQRRVSYRGNARIDGVPGTGSAIAITFEDTVGSSCGALLPTGNALDVIDGMAVTCIDNGMPVVLMDAADFGIDGTESRMQLDQNQMLKSRLESIRLQVGPLMNLGDVREQSVPKMTLLSPATRGGCISTRSFIPHRCHASIGVLAAVSVGTACTLQGSVAQALAKVTLGAQKSLSIEHPSGEMTVVLDCEPNGEITNAAIVRTARKLFDGEVFV